MYRKALICLLMLVAALAMRTALGEAATLMVYMTGSDLESRCAAASDDIDEMIKSVPEDGSLRVILLTGGAAAWHREEIPSGECEMWEVTPGGLSHVCRLTDGGMGEARTLSRFLAESVERYPADTYALILWDHGGGPLGGVCFDETADMDALSLEEITAALDDSPFHDRPLSLIGFDACLMASAEVAGAVAPYGEFMIASQEPEPADGWDYAFIRDIPQQPDGEALARRIADAYTACFADHPAPITLSCVRLSQVDRLDGELDRLFSGLQEAIDPALFEKMAFCRSDVKVLGSASVAEYDLVDLGDLLDEIEASDLGDVTAARQALESAMVFNVANEDYVSGLSVYYPFANKVKYTHPWSARYDALSFAKGYRDWVRASSMILLGDSIVSWRDTRSVKTQAQALKAMIQCDISDDEAAHTVAAELIVLEEAAVGEYRLVWRSSDAEIKGGQITAAYHGEALYALDEAGSLCAGPLGWREVAGGVAVGALLEDEDGTPESLYLIFGEDESGSYSLREVDTYNSGLDMFVPSALAIQPGDSLIFASWTRAMPETDAAYEDWPYGENVVAESLRVPEGGLTLSMLPLTGADRRIALFALYDTQHNVHLTSPSELPDLTRVNVTDISASAEGKYAAVTLNGMTLLNNAAKGLQIDLTLRNLTNDKLTASLAAVTVDGAVLSDLSEHPTVNPDPDADVTLSIPVQALIDARVTQADQITLTVLSSREGDAEIREESFTFDVGVSFALLGIPEPTASAPLAAAETEAVGAELVRCAYDESAQCLRGEILLKNLTDETLSVSSTGVWIDGAEAYGSLCGGVLPLSIPAGCHSRCAFTVWPKDPATDAPIASFAEDHSLSSLTWRLVCRGGDIVLPFDWERE